MMKRRTFLSAALGAAAGGGGFARPVFAAGRLKQGVTRQIFGSYPLAACCREAAAIGVQGFDFIGDPKDWPVLKQFSLTMSMYRIDYGGGISVGRSPLGPPGWHAIGSKEAQGEYLQALLQGIDVAAQEGFPNVIVLAGSRDRMSYQQGAENAVDFLIAVKAKAEEKQITICMELLNSKGRQAPPQSLFDHAAWGFEVVNRVGSSRVKILYDIWHAQLMDGDIIDTITANIGFIGHFHTGGVPDRHELFRHDELDYRFIAQTIADLRFTGFVTHEWSPSKESEALVDLRRSVELMRV